MKIAPIAIVLVVVAALLTLFLAPSCSRDKPTATGPSANADQAALALHRGVGKHELADVWDALPPTWRADVTTLVQDFAAHMDRDVWNRAAATARKASSVLQQKRDFVLTGGAVGLMVSLDDEQRAPAAYDALVEAFEALTSSDLADLAKLEHFDARAFAAGPAAKLLDSAARLSELSDEPRLHQWLERAASADAKLLAQGDDHALVALELDAVGELEAEHIEQVWVKIDGRWVPQELAEEWPELLKHARELVDALSAPQAPKLKGALIQALPVIDGFLDRLAAANTQSEFDSAVRGGSLTLGATFAGMMLDGGLQWLSDDE